MHYEVRRGPTSSERSTPKIVRSRLQLVPLEDPSELPEGMQAIVDAFTAWGFTTEPQECVWVVAFDSARHLRTVVEISRGTPVLSGVHIPTLLAAVITAGCERFILVHNHPDDDRRASLEDQRLTDMVVAAADACHLRLEDHLIVTPTSGWTSFVGEHYMEPGRER